MGVRVSWKDMHKSKTCRTTSLLNIGTKLQQNICKPRNTKMKKEKKNQVGLIPEIQGWVNTCKLINVMDLQNAIKDRNCMIITVDAEKASDKTKPYLHDKSLD